MGAASTSRAGAPCAPKSIRRVRTDIHPPFWSQTQPPERLTRAANARSTRQFTGEIRMGQNGEESPLGRATRRLNAALDTLEAAVNRRHEEDRQRDALEAQLQAFGSDRSRLAAELDQVRARSTDLEAANREVSRRLDRAADTIRTVLAGNDR